MPKWSKRHMHETSWNKPHIAVYFCWSWFTACFSMFCSLSPTFYAFDILWLWFVFFLRLLSLRFAWFNSVLRWWCHRQGTKKGTASHSSEAPAEVSTSPLRSCWWSQPPKKPGGFNPPAIYSSDLVRRYHLTLQRWYDMMWSMLIVVFLCLI